MKKYESEYIQSMQKIDIIIDNTIKPQVNVSKTLNFTNDIII
jgi:hypothetical protein